MNWVCKLQRFERVQLFHQTHCTLSDEARAQLQSLQFCDAELARLQAQAAVLQTARAAYSTALNEALTPAMGEKISFS